MIFEPYLIILLVAVFAAGVFWLKIPSGAALAGGFGLPVRHMVEGAFGYLDAVLLVATAMVFMKPIEASGAPGTISHLMIKPPPALRKMEMQRTKTFIAP